MADINLTLFINDKLVESNQIIRTTEDYPVITWNFAAINEVDINEYTGEIQAIFTSGQWGYDIRISTSSYFWGTDDFVGNRLHTDFIQSQDRFWSYKGYPLYRGTQYYGQIQVKDNFNRSSAWVTFSFLYNTLPIVHNLSILPAILSVNNNLVISYDFIDDDGDTESGTLIRWFKNGVHQKQFDNTTFIRRNFLQVNNNWFVDVLPSDGYEYGERFTSPVAKIVEDANVISGIEIYPQRPNENDILKTAYTSSDISKDDDVSIKWFINGEYNNTYDNLKFMRPDVVVGDTVRYEIKPNSGTVYFSSNTVTIISSNFKVYDIIIDSESEPLQVSTTTPTVRWKIRIPSGRYIQYTSIKIGTFYEADNIYSIIIAGNIDIFKIPVNILNRGRDYYMSIAVNDSNTFASDTYTVSHFRLKGYRWDEAVDNATGWTIETLFLIDDYGIFDPEKYQVVRFHDGTKFGEVRIHSSKIVFLSEKFTSTETIDNSGTIILTIVGKGNDVKIYLNRQLLLDATGLFVQNSSNKLVEIGNDTGGIIADGSEWKSTFAIRYKYFYYNISGAYYPDISREYSNIKFHTFLNFVDSEIVGFKGYVKKWNNSYKNYKIFGVNPDDITRGGSIFSVQPATNLKGTGVNRTFSPINKIRKSPDNNFMVVANSMGISIIKGYTIDTFDQENNFSNLVYPDSKGWTLIQNSGYASAFFSNGALNINTLYIEPDVEVPG